MLEPVADRGPRFRVGITAMFVALVVVGATTTFLAFRGGPVAPTETGKRSGFEAERSGGPSNTADGPSTGATGGTGVTSAAAATNGPGPAGPTTNNVPTTPGTAVNLPTSPSGAGQPTTTSPGEPALRAVPYLYGYSDNVAVAEIRAAGLEPHVDYETTDNQCYVIRQTPAGDTMVPAGTAVFIVVATNRGYCEAA